MVQLRLIQLLLTDLVPFFRKGQFELATAFDYVQEPDKRYGLQPREKKQLRCSNRTKSSGGLLLRRGKASMIAKLASGNALQDNCEYNPFRYGSYPFNAYSQPFSFAFPFLDRGGLGDALGDYRGSFEDCSMGFDRSA